eukprot:snap_masked-scaffold_55-processed-gene-1.43-mRNA-1 protein AED:1.00 eAED:1.00 QI:0/-1/0/0/-1/1/1/0/319
MHDSPEIVLVIYFGRDYCVIRDESVRNILDIKSLSQVEPDEFFGRKAEVSKTFKVQKYITKNLLYKLFTMLQLQINTFRRKYPKERVKFIDHQSFLNETSILFLLTKISEITLINHISLPMKKLFSICKLKTFEKVCGEIIELNCFATSSSAGDCRKCLSLFNENGRQIASNLGKFHIQKRNKLCGSLFIGKLLRNDYFLPKIRSLELTGSLVKESDVDKVLCYLNETQVHLYLRKISFQTAHVRCGRAGGKLLGCLLTKCLNIEELPKLYQNIHRSSHSMIDRAFILNETLPRPKERYYNSNSRILKIFKNGKDSSEF